MSTDVTRRTFLSGAAAAALSGQAIGAQEQAAIGAQEQAAIGAQEQAAIGAQEQAALPDTPAAALQRLVEGNRRFAADQITSIAGDLKLLKEHTVDKQEPFAAVLSCADSRVPVELVFDQTIGHIFVARVAGNIINSEIIGSLEYGAAVLGVKVLVVMGHANCGAVKAAIAKTAVPGQIASLYPHLQPAVEQGGGSLVGTIKKNALLQADLLANTSTVLAPLVKEGKLMIRAAYYDVANGRVSLL